jgi:hypothetical protein
MAFGPTAGSSQSPTIVSRLMYRRVRPRCLIPECYRIGFQRDGPRTHSQQRQWIASLSTDFARAKRRVATGPPRVGNVIWDKERNPPVFTSARPYHHKNVLQLQWLGRGDGGIRIRKFCSGISTFPSVYPRPYPRRSSTRSPTRTAQAFARTIIGQTKVPYARLADQHRPSTLPDAVST